MSKDDARKKTKEVYLPVLVALLDDLHGIDLIPNALVERELVLGLACRSRRKAG